MTADPINVTIREVVSDHEKGYKAYRYFGSWDQPIAGGVAQFRDVDLFDYGNRIPRLTLQ